MMYDTFPNKITMVTEGFCPGKIESYPVLLADNENASILHAPSMEYLHHGYAQQDCFTINIIADIGI